MSGWFGFLPAAGSTTMKTMKMPDDLKAKLNEIMNKWDNSLAPVGIFWRLSDDNNLTLFDYLVTQDLPSISAHNLFGNWQKAQGQGYSGAFCWTNFHVRILTQIRVIGKCPGNNLGARCPT